MTQPQKHHARETVRCALCGQEIPASARACPWCGSDENTGWSDKTYLDGINLGADDEEYEELKTREFGSTDQPQKLKRSAVPLIALGLLILIALGILRSTGCR